MIVRELITKLGFQSDNKALDQFKQSLGTVTKGLTAMVGGATAAAAGAFKLANDTAASGDEIAKTARQLGISAEELQSLRFAFDRMGVSESEATKALEYFNRVLGQKKDRRSLAEALPQIAEEFKGMESETKMAAKAQELFGRSGLKMVLALQDGKKGITDLQKEFKELGGGLTNEQALAAENYTDSMTNLKAALGTLKGTIGAALMPVFKELIDNFTVFIKDNKELIKIKVVKFFEIMIKIVHATYKILGRLWERITDLVKSLGGWESALKKLGYVLGFVLGAKTVGMVMNLFNAFRAFFGLITKSPLGLFIASIPFLIEGFKKLKAAFDEWKTENSGILFEIFGDFEIFMEKLKSLFEGFKTIIFEPFLETFAALGESIKSVFMLDWDSAKANLNLFKDNFLAWAENLSKEVKKIFDSFAPDWLKNAASRGGDLFSSLKDTLKDTGGAALSSINNLITPSQNPTGSMVSNNRSMVINDSRQISIETPMGSTPQQIKSIQDTVKKSLESEVNFASLSLNN